MPQTIPTHTQRQVQTLQRHFAQQPGLPFADLLPEDEVRDTLAAEQLSYRERLYSPLVTLWVFLSQLLDPDHSCRKAVARFLAYRAGQGLSACSANTAAYCQARQRLPERLLATLTRSTGQHLQEQAAPSWLWQRRPVKVVDGSTLTLPDTPANQKAYPQARTQKPGLGFPILRLVVLFSLAVGTVLDAAFGCYRGKQTGETALWHQIQDQLQAGDVLLADRCYGSYFEVALAVQRDADVVVRMHQCRHVDFRTGSRLGTGDHVVSWQKPARPEWMSETDYQALPRTLRMRELRVCVRVAGFRTQTYVLATTLLRAKQVSVDELAELYRRRWQAELNLRALKVSLGMDVLRGQTPEQCQKELWGHLLVYNLIRGVMAQAVAGTTLQPWQISFQGALQTMNEFAPLLRQATAAQLPLLCQRLLRAIRQHRVGQRPNRVEPRAVKRRPKPHKRLTEPRKAVRSRILAGRCG